MNKKYMKAMDRISRQPRKRGYILNTNLIDSEKTILIDTNNEYEELVIIMEKYNSSIIHLTPYSSGCFNPFDLVESTTITTEKIIETMLLIIECTKLANQHIEPEDILKEICNKNNLELSDIDISGILRAIQDKKEEKDFD